MFKEGQLILSTKACNSSHITVGKVYTFSKHVRHDEGFIGIKIDDEGVHECGFMEGYYQFVPATNLHKILYGVTNENN